VAGEKILFADDEEQIRKLLSTFLTRRGYEVRTVTDGLEALRAIREDPPHLVISDVNMPNMNGFELTRRLREDRKTSRIPIIILSARKHADDVLEGYAKGADEYIPKPVEMSIIAAKVETLLRRTALSGGGATAAGTAAGDRRGGLVITFLRGKGGVGATSLAVNTAVALTSSRTYRVTLLDLNLEFGNAAMLMDLRPAATLADLAEMPEIDDKAVEIATAHHASGVDLVSGADLPQRAELVTIATVQKTLDRLRASSDYVIVDAPPTFSQIALAALDASEVACVVTAPHLASLRATADILDVLVKLQFPRDRVLLLLDRTSQRGLENDEIGAFFKRRPDVVVPYAPAFDDAADAGQPLVTTVGTDMAAAAVIRELAAKVANLARSRTAPA